MITGFGGAVTLTWTSLYIGLLWLVAGALCTLVTRQRGLYLAILIPLVVAVTPVLVTVRPPTVPGTFDVLPFGSDLSPYWNRAVIPFLSSVVGGLAGELISPSEEA